MKNNIWNYLAQGFLVLFTIIVSLSCFIFIGKFGNSEISDQLDDWNDYSVCLTALFAFISLMFIYLTYKKQSDYNYKLQFDSTFFNMLQTQREILRSLEDGYFKKRTTRIKDYYPLSWSEKLSKKEALQRVRDAYYGTMPNNDDSGAMHYFRHLYHIIKLTHNSSFNDKQQREYLDIIQAQMSNEELYVMFYNVVSFGNNEYLLWLNNSAFFENIRSTGTLFDQIKTHFFKDTTFKYNAPQINNDDIITE